MSKKAQREARTNKKPASQATSKKPETTTSSTPAPAAKPAPAPAPTPAPTPAPAPAPTSADDSKMPKWFADFSGSWDRKHEEFDQRLKALEDKEKQRAEAEAKAKGEAVAASANPAPAGSASATPVPKPDPDSKPDSAPKQDPKPTAQPKADPKPEQDPIQVAAATAANSKFARGWHPAEAWKYRYWTPTGEMRWGGPLLNVLAAKAAGGGTRDSYEMIPVWVNADLKIMDIMTAEEIDQYFGNR